MFRNYISSLLVTAAVVSLLAAYVAGRERVYYVDFEHSAVVYINPRYVSFANISTRRYSRRDPIHYININVNFTMILDNRTSLHVYLYEFLSNEYRRSFVEMHFEVCMFLLKDKNFGVFFKEKLIPEVKSCPLQKGMYRLVNASIPNLPLFRTFPFKKGRLFANITQFNSGAIDRVVEAYADAVIKTKWIE